MRKVRLTVLMIALAAFVVASEYAIYHHGLVGYFQLGLSSPGMTVYAIQIWALLSLFALWLWHDAQRLGVRAWPYVILTALSGLFGVLVYLLRREFRPQQAASAGRDLDS